MASKDKDGDIGLHFERLMKGLISKTQKETSITDVSRLERIEGMMAKIQQQNQLIIDMMSANKQEQTTTPVELPESPLSKTCQVEGDCRVCVKLHRGTVTDSLGKEVFDTVPGMSCADSNVIYGLLCAKCDQTIYVGETERTLKERVDEHLRDVRQQKDMPILRHFKGPSHSETDVRVTILQRLHNDEGRTLRRMEEENWITKLKTNVPLGCNVQCRYM